MQCREERKCHPFSRDPHRPERINSIITWHITVLCTRHTWCKYFWHRSMKEEYKENEEQ